MSSELAHAFDKFKSAMHGVSPEVPENVEFWYLAVAGIVRIASGEEARHSMPTAAGAARGRLGLLAEQAGRDDAEVEHEFELAHSWLRHGTEQDPLPFMRASAEVRVLHAQALVIRALRRSGAESTALTRRAFAEFVEARRLELLLAIHPGNEANVQFNNLASSLRSTVDLQQSNTDG